MLTSFRRVLVLSVIASLLLLFLKPQKSVNEQQTSIGTSFDQTRVRKGRLHLLVPATSTNQNLCALLLSVQILGYPTPVLINYGDKEDADPYKQHMDKVKGILDHLDLLQSSEEFERDMILVVDGYDVWFQLRPDVLLKRYYAVTQAADRRVQKLYGDGRFKAQGMHHTVLFGPDKICWPVDYSRAACWAAPPTPLSAYAFGPCTRSGRGEHNDPRWLNSGTIMGPLDDMRRVFRATLHWINEQYTVDSDQFYFAELFGLQEYTRLLQRPELLDKAKHVPHGHEGRTIDTKLVRNKPALAMNRTEYHIMVDGTSSLFQTLAYWKPYLVWLRSANAWQANNHSSRTRPGTRFFGFDLSTDLTSSPPPIAFSNDRGSMSVSWKDVELLYNVISGHAPVLVHFTGDKNLRRIWWKRIWWQSSARLLRELIRGNRRRDALILGDRIDGLMWHNHAPQSAGLELPWHINESVMTDAGVRLTWDKVCGTFESGLFVVPGDHSRHPSSLQSDIQFRPNSSNITSVP